MSSAINLENYPVVPAHAELQNLPYELQRNLKLIGELDERVGAVEKRIEILTEEFKRKMVNGITKEEHQQRLADIQALFRKGEKYSNDKVQLAELNLQLVNKQLQRSDVFLPRSDNEIPEKTSSTRNKSKKAVVKKNNRKNKKSKVTGKDKHIA